MAGQTDTLKLRVSQFCERTVKMGETFHDLFQIHFVSLSPVDALILFKRFADRESQYIYLSI